MLLITVIWTLFSDYWDAELSPSVTELTLAVVPSARIPSLHWTTGSARTRTQFQFLMDDVSHTQSSVPYNIREQGLQVFWWDAKMEKLEVLGHVFWECYSKRFIISNNLKILCIVKRSVVADEKNYESEWKPNASESKRGGSLLAKKT